LGRSTLRKTMTEPPWKFQHEGLSIVVTRSTESATVKWIGVSDSRTPGEFLNPLIQQLVQKLKGLKITMDLRALEYMNSSTVAPLINMVRQLDTSANKVFVWFDSASDWQQTHLKCMRTISRTLRNVSVDGVPLDSV